MFVKVVGVLVGAILLLQYVNGQTCICKCGPSGLFGEEDLCSRRYTPPGPLVVRPKPLAKPTVALPLFGGSDKGPCYRRQAIVKPAVVPRPVYVQGKFCTQTCNGNTNLASAVAAAAAQLLGHSASSCTSTTSNSHSSSNVISQAISHASGAIDAAKTIDVSRAYDQLAYGGPASAPADAVSLAMAYKQTQNNYNRKVSEDRLAYGFRKLPIDAPCPKTKIYKQVLPEGSLYALNGQVVELKPVTEANCESLSEEAQEELLDLAISEENDDVKVARRPSLCELGYGPAKITPATFIDVPAVTPKLPVPGDVSIAPPCNDGFKSGTVEYRDYPNEHIVDVNKSGESCESQEEAVRHIAVPRPSCQCNYDGNIAGLVNTFATALKSTTSHTSSSSCAHKKSVLFQKMCA